MRTLLILALAVVLAGCAHRPVRSGITYFVGAECHPSAKMLHCDQNSPPNCGQITLKYDRACEQIVASK